MCFSQSSLAACVGDPLALAHVMGVYWKHQEGCRHPIISGFLERPDFGKSAAGFQAALGPRQGEFASPYWYPALRRLGSSLSLRFSRGLLLPAGSFTCGPVLCFKASVYGSFCFGLARACPWPVFHIQTLLRASCYHQPSLPGA